MNNLRRQKVFIVFIILPQLFQYDLFILPRVSTLNWLINSSKQSFIIFYQIIILYLYRFIFLILPKWFIWLTRLYYWSDIVNVLCSMESLMSLLESLFKRSKCEPCVLFRLPFYFSNCWLLRRITGALLNRAHLLFKQMNGVVNFPLFSLLFLIL